MIRRLDSAANDLADFLTRAVAGAWDWIFAPADQGGVA
jgi:hypothetical protein